jgi:DNA-directed RNA polymerase specialized sigma24 family protein
MKNLKTNVQECIPDLIVKLGTTDRASLQWLQYWRQFDNQVAKFLWSICRNTASITELFCEEEMEDLVSVSRHKIYEKLSTFKLPPDISSKAGENRIKKWFVTIFRNVYRDMLSQKNKETDIFARLEDFDTDSFTISKDQDYKISPKNQQLLELIYKAIKHLSARDREVWYTYVQNRDSKGRIPDYILRNLESKFKLKPGYSSKIYARATDKIKQFIKHTHNEKADRNDTGDDEVSG